jgi:putative ATP-dependent endonuclease of OLD family
VISVSGLAFKRFLEIAKALSLTTAVVTDNDGNYEKRVTDKYADYSESGAILICADSDNQLRTLEDHILKHNDRTTLNGIFGTTYSTDAEILEYMKENKTEWALAVYAAASEIDYPPYVLAAIS